jgi:hypothetical protein
MRFRTIDLTGMITGLGRINLLSVRIQHYRVGVWIRYADFAPAIHRAAVPPAGPRRIQLEADFQLRFFFFFKSIL